MTIYRGVGGVNREIKQQFRGVGGVNREIKEQYRGVGGVTRKVFSSGLSLPILYNSGQENIADAGGWVKFYISGGDSGIALNNGSQIVCTANSSADVGMITNNKINLANYNYVYAQVDYYSGGQRGWLLAQNSKVSGGNWDFSASISFTGTGKIALPISSISTSHYIYIGASANGSIKVSKIWLE
ncbi:hypothetical protein [Aminipila terrae]|uniref:Uncharacterized protein n=1 Tax=Aminipila terrae TaxID=2697030 RepID=A0A6P1MKU9_9FIRM|nr:hypothetical protein [Aminipila terrae]QHI73773.1 hypothetical protein Ami3637_16525 [Aminipila terrae]